MDKEKMKNWIKISVNDIVSDPMPRRDVAKMLVQYCADNMGKKTVQQCEDEFSQMLVELLK